MRPYATSDVHLARREKGAGAGVGGEGGASRSGGGGGGGGGDVVELPCFSMNQPFAALVAHGFKTLEVLSLLALLVQKRLVYEALSY
jgi:hypothetical protein